MLAAEEAVNRVLSIVQVCCSNVAHDLFLTCLADLGLQGLEGLLSCVSQVGAHCLGVVARL